MKKSNTRSDGSMFGNPNLTLSYDPDKDPNRKEKKSYYKPVAGRRKSKEGTKRKQTKYEGARTFEYETIKYLQNACAAAEQIAVVFRRPVSQSPADVWCYGPQTVKQIGFIETTPLVLTQCKTTLDTKPPPKDSQEVKKFLAYCGRLKASACWACRYKKNKNVYIRQMEKWDLLTKEWTVHDPDFSAWLKWKPKLGP
jgi:hypothetical protein